MAVSDLLPGGAKGGGSQKELTQLKTPAYPAVSGPRTAFTGTAATAAERNADGTALPSAQIAWSNHAGIEFDRSIRFGARLGHTAP